MNAINGSLVMHETNVEVGYVTTREPFKQKLKDLKDHEERRIEKWNTLTQGKRRGGIWKQNGLGQPGYKNHLLPTGWTLVAMNEGPACPGCQIAPLRPL